MFSFATVPSGLIISARVPIFFFKMCDIADCCSA